MKKENQQRKIKQILLAVIVFTIGYFTAQEFIFKGNKILNDMKGHAAVINENCPVKVDKYARLDSAVVIDKNTFQYNYTLIDLNKAEINLDTANKYIKPGLIDQAKTNPALKVFRENKVTFNHHYIDRNGDFVTDITVTPEIYLEN